MKLITQHGIVNCKENLDSIPKYILQSYLHFMGVECGRKTTKKELCNFITNFKKFETDIKHLKKIPLTEFLSKETNNERNIRLKGGCLSEKEWKTIHEKCKLYLHKH